MTYERMGTIENDLAMIKPRLTGTDGKGNPFVITADAAIQDAKNPKRARLQNVEADLSLDKKAGSTPTPPSGVVDMRAGSLELDGGIDVFSDSGYELHTSPRRRRSQQTDRARRSATVTGQGPAGHACAPTSFHYRPRQHISSSCTGMCA